MLVEHPMNDRYNSRELLGTGELWGPSNGTTVCQRAVLAAFAPLGGPWCCFRLRFRLKGG